MSAEPPPQAPHDERPVRARHRLEYALVRTVGAVVRWLPMRAVRAWGGALGRAAYAIDARHRRIAIENLAQAFPERAPRERRAIARATFAHFGSALLELLKIETLSTDQLLRLVENEGEARVFEAYTEGRGALFVTGHYGYWEVQAIVGAVRVRPFTVLARPLDNPLLHAWLERIRTKTGNAVVARQGAIRKVLRELAENRGVAVLIDQHLLTPDVVQVDFFGRPAATTSALAALAARTKAPVIPVFALPLPGGRYRLVYEPAVAPPEDDSPDAMRAFTQRCTSILEGYVRRHPELWLWMHKRWR